MFTIVDDRNMYPLKTLRDKYNGNVCVIDCRGKGNKIVYAVGTSDCVHELSEYQDKLMETENIATYKIHFAPKNVVPIGE